MDRTDLAKDYDRRWAVVNAGNFLTSFSRRTVLQEVSIPRRYNVDGRIETNLSGPIESISQQRLEGLRNPRKP